MARILVVDDEHDLREFMVEALEDEGHEVSQAADGAAGLNVARQHGFDLVITDLRMPRMHGMDLLKQLKAEQPEVEVLVLTAHGRVQGAVEAMRLGAFDFIIKPLQSPAALRLLVQRALEHRSLCDRAQIAAPSGPTLTWGASTMTPVVRALERVASTNATVLLLGESGTGKEVAARSLHEQSQQRDGPFVAVNCAALSENLLESELFGHERGAFTGAVERRRGRLELAAGGSFFLDEVGELPLPMQAKLLRVLQERRFERVGGHQTLQADVRWIAATNRDLTAMIAAGTFREDLYHRLAVFPIVLPALRERTQDIWPLAQLLLTQVSADLGRPGLTLSQDIRTTLHTHPWTGNVRELRNTLERAAIMCDGATIEPDDMFLFGGTATPPQASLPTLEQAERTLIERTLAHYDGHRKQAAAHLGIGLRTLYDKLKRYDID
ncbi:MAG: two-component system response regulator AtoC [Kiritimatiellia bacterium]|jgi:two-component system response regulator AtoC